MANINTDLIVEAIARGEDYVIQNITDRNLGYIRCWANRKGWFVTKDGADAVVSKEKADKLRTEIYKNLPAGKMFLVTVPANRRQYLRNLISIYNKTAEVRYKTSRVTKPANSLQYIIYPDPLSQIKAA